MSDVQSESPRYAKCNCQYCDNGIEFDANLLTTENNIVPCPHCGRETLLSIPKKSFSENVKEKSGLNMDFLRNLPRSDDDEFAHELHGNATPKQIAYLTYMGIKNAQNLTKQEASDMIASNSFLGEIKSMAQWDRLTTYQNKWDAPERTIKSQFL